MCFWETNRTWSIFPQPRSYGAVFSLLEDSLESVCLSNESGKHRDSVHQIQSSGQWQRGKGPQSFLTPWWSRGTNTRVCRFHWIGVQCFLERWTWNKHQILVQLPHLTVEKTAALKEEFTCVRSHSRWWQRWDSSPALPIPSPRPSL